MFQIVHAQQTISDDSSEYVRKFINIAKIFLSISDYRDARGLAQKCLDEAEIIRNKLYNEAIDAIKNAGKKSCLWEIAQCKLNNSVLDDYCNIDELRKRTEKRYVKCLTAENERKKQLFYL